LSDNTPYNPLNKTDLAWSIARTLLERGVHPLSKVDGIVGAGIYAIYYAGKFKPYAPVARANTREMVQPIYVGKAIPKGGRKGGLTKDASKGRALAERLRQHANSIDECQNLNLADFSIRHLVVEDIWIPLGENMLIENFKPLWNQAIDGFGNKDPGKRRSKQYKSPWDVFHPGRSFTIKLADSGIGPDFIEERVADFFAGRKLKKYPKKLAEQIEEEQADAEQEADEAPL
jgi:hypothetical protein